MSKQLTMRGLKESVDGLRVQVRGLDTQAQRLDTRVEKVEVVLKGIRVGVQGLREDIGVMRGDVTHLGDRFSNLQSSVDQYLKRTEAWHDEQVILKARHDRLSDSLVKKGTVTKGETLL